MCQLTVDDSRFAEGYRKAVAAVRRFERSLLMRQSMTTHERRVIEQVIAAWDAAQKNPGGGQAYEEDIAAQFAESGGVEPLRKLLDESRKVDD